VKDPHNPVLKRLAQWAEWTTIHERERGWPSESTEARAMEQAKGSTKTDGIARWRGCGEPPQMPKETRQKAGSRPPCPVWGYAPVDEVDRLLNDLFAEHRVWCEAVKLKALAPGCTMAECARAMGLAERTYRRCRREGLLWLSRWLK